MSAAGLQSYVYHGFPIRGVIAVFEKTARKDPHGKPLPAVLFIDGRPVGSDVNFYLLDEHFVTRDHLSHLVRVPVPFGRRLAVKGGRRLGNRYEFHSGEVLTLAFLPEEDIGDEQHESETGGSSDDPCEPDGGSSGPPSDRSRSDRHDRSEPSVGDVTTDSHHDASGARSPNATAHGASGHRGGISCFKFLTEISLRVHRALTSWLNSKLVQFVPADYRVCDGPCQLIGPVVMKGSALPDFTVRTGGNAGMTHEEHLQLLLFPFGDGVANDAPPFGPQRVVPMPGAIMQVQPQRISATFVVLTPDFAPEVLTLDIPTGSSVRVALELADAEREPDRRRLLQWLEPACPQPTSNYATILALPDWTNDTVAVFDLQALTQVVFAVVVPLTATREDLLAMAGLSADLRAEVFVHVDTAALLPGQLANLWSGVTVVFSPPEHVALSGPR